jgi:ABC-type proline/glycine betaine transport system substrate-binding protein
LAAGRAANLTVEQSAVRFLKERPEIWRRWLPEDIANRVASAL